MLLMHEFEMPPEFQQAIIAATGQGRDRAAAARQPSAGVDKKRFSAWLSIYDDIVISSGLGTAEGVSDGPDTGSQSR
jgi:hypothetical protein